MLRSLSSAVSFSGGTDRAAYDRKPPPSTLPLFFKVAAPSQSEVACCMLSIPPIVGLGSFAARNKLSTATQTADMLGSSP